MDNIIERRIETQKAREKGLKRYVSKFPCKRGHFNRVFTVQGPRCPDCFSYFNKLYKGRYDSRTLDDHAIQYRRYRSQLPKHFWAKEAVHHAKERAKKKGLLFNLTVAYLESIVVDRCPVLGIKLSYGRHNRIALPNSPSLDRIKSGLGYIIGNVKIISHRANTIKQDATVDELKRVLRYVCEQNGGP